MWTGRRYVVLGRVHIADDFGSFFVWGNVHFVPQWERFRLAVQDFITLLPSVNMSLFHTRYGITFLTNHSMTSTSRGPLVLDDVRSAYDIAIKQTHTFDSFHFCDRW